MISMYNHACMHPCVYLLDPLITGYIFGRLDGDETLHFEAKKESSEFHQVGV